MKPSKSGKPSHEYLADNEETIAMLELWWTMGIQLEFRQSTRDSPWYLLGPKRHKENQLLTRPSERFIFRIKTDE